MQIKMNEKAALIMNALKGVSPINIHLKTNANQGIRDSFHSVWFRHTPQAARFMLMPYIFDGRVELTK